MEFENTIGLETHVQLKTRTKMFCGCLLKTGCEPNTNVCPVCLGYPGAFPSPAQSRNAACAAARRAIGTRNGEQLT